MKKNLIFAGLLLSMILVLGIIPFVSADGITGEVTITGKYTQADCDKACAPRAGTVSSAGTTCTCSAYEIATQGETTTTRTSTSTTGTSGTRASTAPKIKGWQAVEAADENIGICYKRASKRGARAGILGLFIRE